MYKMDTQHSATDQPSSLLELTAQIIAKYYSASDLDQHVPLDESLLVKVLYFSFPRDIRSVQRFAEMTDREESWKRGVRLEQENGVREIYQIGFMVTAYLTRYPNYVELSKLLNSRRREPEQPIHGEVRVSLLVEKQKIIKTTCSECTTVWCEHVFAASIHRIKHPEKVTVHAPMTESLSSLSRDQLQKLLQYAVDEDPGGVMGKIFKRYKEIRDTNSEINKIDGAPDPSYEGLEGGEQSQWSLTMDIINTRIINDIGRIRGVKYVSESPTYIQYEPYPSTYDLTLKMNSKVFAYINNIGEFIRQGEYMCAAEVMNSLVINTPPSMIHSTTVGLTFSNVSHWWHDVTHLHALLILRTEDGAARKTLLNATNKITVTPVMKQFILKPSDWTELPPITLLFPVDAETLSTEGCMMIESVLANQLQSNPQDLQRLLDGTDSIENTSYNEDLIIMLARLESMYYFDKNHKNMLSLGLLILDKLSIQAYQYSVVGQFVRSLWGKESESLVSSSSSTVQPMDTDSPTASKRGRKMSEEPSNGTNKRFKPMEGKEEVKTSSGFVWSCTHVAHAMLFTLRLFIESQTESSLASSKRKALIGFCLQALELSRYRMQAEVKTQFETINFSSDEPSSNQSDTSSSQSARRFIRQHEYDWCGKLETIVCDYLRTVGVDECHAAVCMYINSLCSFGKSFYSSTSKQKDSLNIYGEYPLLLLESLCNLFRNDDALKLSKSKQFKKIFTDILLGTTSDQVYNSLHKKDLLQTLLKSSQKKNTFFSVHDFYDIIDKFCTDSGVKKFHVIIEMFVSFVVTESSEDIQLVTTIRNHLEYISNFALLKLISTILQQAHFWRFRGNEDEVKSVLKSSINSYHSALGLSTCNASSSSSDSALNTLMTDIEFETSRNIEKDFVLFLFKKLNMSALAIFSKVWQHIFSCKELQDLLLYFDKKDNKKNCSGQERGRGLIREILPIIDEFYNAKLPHDEDACTLLTRYFTPGSDQYKRITNKIINNIENYHPVALFHLAKLLLTRTSSNITQSKVHDLDPYMISESLHSNASNDLSQPSRDGVDNTTVPMDFEKFYIVEKAFKKLGSNAVSSEVLDAVECVFNSCVTCGTWGQRFDITNLQFYGKLIQCVCQYAEHQPQIILKILQRIDFICGGIESSYLAQHESITALGSALLVAYRQYFGYRLSDIVHVDHKEVVQEMLIAKSQCKKLVQNGDIEFDNDVVKNIRIMHSTKKEFINMLHKEFPVKYPPPMALKWWLN